MEYLIPSVLFVAIDSVYLNLSSSFFNGIVKGIQGSPLKLNMTGAIICYLFLVFGLYYFIIRKRGTVQDAFLFGLTVYGVFEFTNRAIFKKWPVSATIIDTLWGGILFALTTWVSYKVFGLLRIKK